MTTNISFCILSLPVAVIIALINFLLYYIKFKSIIFICSGRLILCHILIRDYYFIVLRKLPLLFRYTFKEGEMQCTYSATLGAFWERSLGWKMRFLFDICVLSIWFQWFGLIYFSLLYRHLLVLGSCPKKGKWCWSHYTMTIIYARNYYLCTLSTRTSFISKVLFKLLIKSKVR